MANITVKHLLDGVAEILQDTADDEDEREWPESYLVDCYNIEARKIASKFPDACTLTEAIQLAAGVKQSIPSGGIALIGVIMNMGDDGETHGTPVIKCSLGEMQIADRSWNTADSTEEILNFMPDVADPRSFYNYPPSDGTGYVLEEYSVVPDQITWDEAGDWETSAVAISEKYLGMLEKKIIERAYKKDSDIPGNMERENDTGQEALMEG